MSYMVLPARRAAAILAAWPSRYNGATDLSRRLQAQGPAAGSYTKIERFKTVAIISSGIAEPCVKSGCARWDS
jgi:hypothetical protein